MPPSQFSSASLIHWRTVASPEDGSRVTGMPSAVTLHLSGRHGSSNVIGGSHQNQRLPLIMTSAS